MGKLTLTEHLKACAASAKNFTNGLVGELAQTVTDAMTEMDAVKADKSGAVSFLIPADGWNIDEAAEDYPYYYDLAVTGVTAKDRATITIAPDGMSAAISCGICPTNETVAGAIRIRSNGIPADAIRAEYWLDQGKE